MQSPSKSLPSRAFGISKSADSFLEALAKELQIPDSRYEEAERRYKSVGQWLCRENSTLRHLNPKVHIQGSFGLGTVNKPVNEEEDYDIDMVAEFGVDLNKATQKQLKEAVMTEMAAYAKAYSMEKPEPCRRCVRLNYSEEAQFHIDVTPGVPNGNYQKMLLKARGISNEWIDLSVAITDEKHWAYAVCNPNWPNSNPRGYLKWFHSRMKVIFEQRRQAIALQAKTKVENIPDYKVKTPLQFAIQILKRHRDMTHEGDPADRPISIIITTLAALAYNGESSISAALYGILDRMEAFIEKTGETVTIPNPTDPNENFADKWREHPEREQAFFDWLEKAKTDFRFILDEQDINIIGEYMSPVLGAKLVEKSVNSSDVGKTGLLKKIWSLNNPTHKQALIWPMSFSGTIRINTAQYKRKTGGFRWASFKSGANALPKNCDLRFEAVTNVSEPYEVYWQVVNTGSEAESCGQLRGGFSVGLIEHGKLARNESTSYRGTHTIECFIIKNGYCVASSGQYVVNIR